MSQDSEREFVVEAHHITTRFVSIRAIDAEEAIRLVKEGHGEVYDSEPGPDIFKPRWTAKLRIGSKL